MELSILLSTVFPSIRIRWTPWGWSTWPSSRKMDFTISTTRLTFTPPPVLPAQAPHNHQKDQDAFGEAGPQVEIHTAVAGGGHDAPHLEEGRPEGFLHGLEPVPDLLGNGQAGGQDDAKVSPDFFHGKGFLEAGDQEQIIEAEVHPEGDHEQGDDPLLDGGCSWRSCR